MKIILLGPPGAGKGTVAEQLQHDFGLLQVSAGELLREEVSKDTSLGKDIKQYMEKGELVPDEFVTQMMKLHIQDKENYILDGFPRSVPQAKDIEDLNVNLVIYIDVPDDVVVERFAGRRIDPETGNTYHLKYVPPPEEIKDRLTQRKDDKPEVIKERLRIYHSITKPVRDYYKKKDLLKTVNGAPPPKEVYEEVKKVVEEFLSK
ncbi:nucleoside monophosphate kinase [Candidatus Woesearchaeota archaeon]|nr:nucleoside monophosphate kinase [Candidatus Woesearchaeota archaeon]